MSILAEGWAQRRSGEGSKSDSSKRRPPPFGNPAERKSLRQSESVIEGESEDESESESEGVTESENAIENKSACVCV